MATHANAVVDQEQQMNELGMDTSQVIFVILVMGLAFLVGYSIGFNSGKEEGFRKGYARGRALGRNRAGDDR
jgi:flagellar biosynthesis/type III secretory pathway protein FliH